MLDVHNDSRVSRILEEALLEDIGVGDITTESIVASDAVGRGSMMVKEPGVIAGLEVTAMLFRIVDAEMRFESSVQDGTSVQSGTCVASVDGSLDSMLKAERVALNIVQRMSGIATLTKQFVDAVRGTHAKITDTRKTSPGIRILDKRAVQLGGGVNHRFGLDDMVLIKDNHITAAGGIDAAIRKCLSYMSEKNYRLPIEVETKNLMEVEHALKHRGIHRIMLDNFSVDNMKQAVNMIGRAAEVEASGNVSLENVRAIADTGVGFISVGALTHSPKALDISLKIVSPSTRQS
jgi:nicotinate-nucleotide pyrophosphorylase (carboxylating)